MRALKARVESGAQVVLVSQGLDHVMRPLAQHLGVKWLVANRLEFRDGIATGRLLDPVIRPRGLFARMRHAGADGRLSPNQWSKDLGAGSWNAIVQAIIPAERETVTIVRPVVHWDTDKKEAPLSVRRALAGKHVMLIGVTGFIGKVGW